MAKTFKELSMINQRSFYATLVCFLTCLINLVYYLVYNKNPLILVALMPIVFWIAYDGNENQEAAKKGFWYWIILLLATSILVKIYPLF
jgi:hypothetical protein